MKKLIDYCYKRTIDLLAKHRDQLDKLAKDLLEKEVIFKEDLESIFGKRPFDDNGNPAPDIKSDLSEQIGEGEEPRPVPGAPEGHAAGQSGNGNGKDHGDSESAADKDEPGSSTEEMHR